ncbi:MAG: hypothetical protein Kow0020_02310 [Wenzhouxiangellaceae bacterium]
MPGLDAQPFSQFGAGLFDGLYQLIRGIGGMHGIMDLHRDRIDRPGFGWRLRRIAAGKDGDEQQPDRTPDYHGLVSASVRMATNTSSAAR